MVRGKTTFALFFGNRGFFPESLMAGARHELSTRVAELGYGVVMADEAMTRYGAVETPAEGRLFADFLAGHRGKLQGVILCLPNFGDETGAVEALRDCGVPILLLAYPDELDKMGTSLRRDAFCGKFSIMDVFTQYGLPFTAFPPHVMHPCDPRFEEHLHDFAAVCRVTAGLKRCTVGAIGARTSAFKTVRFDELTLQKRGITTEVYDLSEIIRRVQELDREAAACKAKAEHLRDYTDCSGVPAESFSNLVRLGVILDEVVEEQQLDALALRCWLELEQTLKVSPCVLLSDLNDRLIPAACELDICNAVAMYALQLATGRSPACLDWNNNYGDDPDKCILFHCGPVAQSLMTAKGTVIDHPMFAKALGAGCGFGCNVGRIAPTPFSFASAATQDGRLHFYLGEGEITEDPIAHEFFGCAGVAHIEGLQQKLNQIGYAGHRHHVSISPGHVSVALREAFTRYLGYELMDWKA